MSNFNGMTSSDANGDWHLNFAIAGSQPVAIQCWSIYITTVADGRLEFDSFDVVSTPIAGDGVLDNTVNVSGVNGSLSKVTVSLFLTHPNDADLKIKLISPTGHEVILAQNAGGTGNNYGNGCPSQMRTTFDSSASKSLNYYSAPYAGTFKPQGVPLTNLNGLSGADVNGTWHLEITDSLAGNMGTLNCWALNLWSSALDVLPIISPQPLPDTWSQAGFSVTNTSNDPIDDVTLTAAMPMTLSIVQDLMDEGSKLYPNCTLVVRNLTCTFAEIDAHTTVYGAVWAKIKHTLPNGKLCLTGVGPCSGYCARDQAAVHRPAPLLDARPGHGLRDWQDCPQPEAQGSERQRRFAVPVPWLIRAASVECSVVRAFSLRSSARSR